MPIPFQSLKKRFFLAFENRFEHRVAIKLLALLLLPACAFLGLWNNVQAKNSPRPETEKIHVEWPAQWQGQALRPLALSEVEQRFARGFPGQIARLTNGHDVLVWRHVTQATRMLHPATDCYRAIGWRVHDERLEQAKNGQRWRCFTAELGSQRQRVCERIEDAAGQSFTDASAWYWAAVSGQSRGPWQAITVAEKL